MAAGLVAMVRSAAMARGGAPQTSSRSQQALRFRGVLLLAFGLAEGALLLLAFRVPDITTSLLVFVMVTFVILDALATLFEASSMMWQRRAWALLVCKALVGVAAAIAIVLRVRSHALTTFGWWAVVTGGLEAVEALAFSAQGPWRFIVAGLSIAFGLVVVAGRWETAVLVLMAGLYGVVAGIARLVAARRAASPSQLFGGIPRR